MTAIHTQYNTVFSEFKLTFEATDSNLAAVMDHEFIWREDCEQGLEDVCKDALAACAEDGIVAAVAPFV